MDMNKQKIHNCKICKKPDKNLISNSKRSYYVCNSCNNKFLYGIKSNEDKVSKIENMRSMAAKEGITLFLAFNVSIGNCSIEKARLRMEEINRLKMLSNSLSNKHRKSKNCRICKNLTKNIVSNQSHSYYLCENCNKRFFTGIQSPEVKTDRLDSAINLANSENLNLLYALNIEMGLYDLEEAKRRIAMKKMDSSKSTTDIFVIGKRLPGSYK